MSRQRLPQARRSVGALVAVCLLQPGLGRAQSFAGDPSALVSPGGDASDASATSDGRVGSGGVQPANTTSDGRVGGAGVIVAGGGARASAEDPSLADARAAFERASRAYESGRYHEALAGFQAAYRQAPLAAFHFNIAQCHRLLHRPGEALASYRKYLESSQAPPGNEALTLDLISEMESRLTWQRRTEQELRGRIESELKGRYAQQLEAERRVQEALQAESAAVRDQLTQQRTPLHRRWYFWAGVGVLLVGSGFTVMAAQSH